MKKYSCYFMWDNTGIDFEQEIDFVWYFYDGLFCDCW